MENANSVTVSRLTLASAADFLRDYRQELDQSGTKGEYTSGLDETVQALDAVLGDGTQAQAGEEDR